VSFDPFREPEGASMKKLYSPALAACLAVLALAAPTFAAPLLGVHFVPEIDPGSIAGASALLIGGLLLLTDRLRRRRK
jgi:hypothetical protein